jgi:hypothetical protein
LFSQHRSVFPVEENLAWSFCSLVIRFASDTLAARTNYMLLKPSLAIR